MSSSNQQWRPLFLIQLLLTLTPPLSAINDTSKLITFKASLSNTTALTNWNPSTPPCNATKPNWTGLICNKDGAVLGLRLENMGLTGTIDMDTLAQITSLRTLSFANNSFEGLMPNVRKIVHLRSVYLSNNGFSGAIRDDAFAGMNSMRKIALGNNRFTGKIPESLTKLSILVDLQLQDNEFEGEIPDFEQKDLKVKFRNNRLEGPIPQGLRNQDPSSFAGNNICGKPLNTPCKIAKNQNTHKNFVIAVTIASLLAITVISFLLFRTRRTPKNQYKYHQTTKLHNINNDTDDQTQMQRRHEEQRYKRTQNANRLQFVRNGRERFELQDLLRASAEVLGGGGFGSSYKAAVVGGSAVVVKRFREMKNVRKEEFEAHMRKIGGFRHTNLLPLVGFYYKKDEKLLISEFAENGSLASHLHGKRKANEAGLDWPTRLNIIKGVARGLNYLYNELPHLSLPHGHLKSSNVLLDDSFNPLLSDYALIPLVAKNHAQQFMVAYKSPEFTHHNRTGKKTDIWCLGILILEVLTGRFPANYLRQGRSGSGSDLEMWVNSVVREEWTSEVFDKEMKGTRNGEGEMLKLLKIGMCCCEWNVDRRWDLTMAVEKIEGLKERGDGEEYSSYASEGDGYSSRGMTDDDFSFSVAG